MEVNGKDFEVELIPSKIILKSLTKKSFIGKIWYHLKMNQSMSTILLNIHGTQ